MIVLSLYKGLMEFLSRRMNCRSGTSIGLTDRVRDEAIRRAAQHYGVPACVVSSRDAMKSA